MSKVGVARRDTGERARPAMNRWYALGLLAVMYMVHSIDRQMIGVVVEPLKREFALTDLSVGLLTGLAYSTSFSAACLPIGWLADRVNRRNLLVCLLTVWSGLTTLCGFATSYVSLVVARIGVGAAEAGAQPTALSLISDVFGPEERSTAIGFFYISTALGIAVSFLAGGTIAAAEGWRAVFIVAGAPGLLVSMLLVITFREPVRQRSDFATENDSMSAPSVGTVVAYVVHSPPLLHLAAAITLTALSVPSMWIWLSSIMTRLHHLPPHSVGIIGALAALAQGAGAAVIGRIADRQGLLHLPRVPLVAAAAAAVSGALGILYAYAPSAPSAVIFLLLVSFSLGGCLGPSYSVFLTMVPARMRGVTSAALQVSINLIGSGLGPLMTGALSDFFGGPESLRPAMMITLSINFWSAVHYVFVYRSMRMSRCRGE